MQDAFMRRPAIRIALVIIAFAAAAALAIGDVMHRAAARRVREAILAELQPVVLKNCTLKRFGSANDGGYLMCENLIEPLDAGTPMALAATTTGDASYRAGITSRCISTTVLILPGQPVTAARSCFTTNVSAIAAATGVRISSTHWKTRSGRTATRGVA